MKHTAKDSFNDNEANQPDGLHVAIIMDGNGRWASRRGLPRTAGHRAGADAVRRVVEAAPDLGVATLTLFAFSSDNWRRPPDEVSALMGLLRQYLRSELRRLTENGVRLTVIGRRDRLPDGLGDDITDAEHRSVHGARLHLRIALDYSSRDAILEAAAAWGAAAWRDVACSDKTWRDPLPPSREDFRRLLAAQERGAAQGRGHCQDVDLLIRSGGEQRLSDFLLWESAYAELRFTPVLWPDFGGDDLRAAVADFHGRERRFGGLCGVEQLTAAE